MQVQLDNHSFSKWKLTNPASQTLGFANRLNEELSVPSLAAVTADWQDITIRHWDDLAWVEYYLEQLKRVITLLEEGRTQEPTATLLHWASRCDAYFVLEQLLQDPHYDINARCSQDQTALEWAIAANSTNCIRILRPEISNGVITIEPSVALFRHANYNLKKQILRERINYRNSMPISQVNIDHTQNRVQSMGFFQPVTNNEMVTLEIQKSTLCLGSGSDINIFNQNGEPIGALSSNDVVVIKVKEGDILEFKHSGCFSSAFITINSIPQRTETLRLVGNEHHEPCIRLAVKVGMGGLHITNLNTGKRIDNEACCNSSVCSIL